MGIIKDGAVSGILPETEGFVVHYPGYPSSTARAIETLGGIPEIVKTRISDSNYMELRFRPEDPYSHPAFGELRPCSSLLLKISKTKSETSDLDVQTSSADHQEASSPSTLSADVVARVHQAYHFEGMVDYQHVLAVHAAESRRKKRPWASDAEPQFEKGGLMDIDQEDVMMLVPPLFSLKDMPEKIVLNPSASLFSKNMQKGVVEHRWEMDIEPCLAIAFDIEKFIRIPEKINWEDYVPKDTTEWEWQMAVSKLFDERPIWPRWSLLERLLDDGLQVTESHLKRLLFRAGYYFSTGPFGRFWIRKGYDPRKDPESRIYQRVDFRMPPSLRRLGDANTNDELKHKWKDICRFQVFPSKSFTCLQFFELVDDYIQQGIKTPSEQTTCTRATGWFSRFMLKTLRLRVSIRFLSIFPKGDAEDLLKSTRELFERTKKLLAIDRISQPEEEQQLANIDSDSSAEVPCIEFSGAEHEHEDQDGPDNCEIEDEEEEEEELDGYESPPVLQAGEDDSFSLDASSYQIGKGIPNNYLQELLRGFPFIKEGKDYPSNDGVQGDDVSDGEYQIYEQDSDENGNDNADDDDFS